MVFRGPADTTIQRGLPFIKSATETLIDDASTTKQVVTSSTGIVVTANNLSSAAGGNAKVFLHNYMPLPASDNTAPTGTVTINAGAAGTNTTAVTVAAPGADNAGGSGMSLIRISNSGATAGGVLTTGSTFVYTTPIAWTLTAGEGTKTVFVQWRDAAGNWSTPVSDTIELDNTGPTGTVEINDGDVRDRLHPRQPRAQRHGRLRRRLGADRQRGRQLHRCHPGPVRADRAASARERQRDRGPSSSGSSMPPATSRPRRSPTASTSSRPT